MSWIDDLALPHATVTAKLARVFGDSDDEDLHPDVQPVGGAARLVPSIRVGVVDGVTVQVEDVPALIFGGELLSEAMEPLRILSTDVDLGTSTDFTWTAVFQAEGMRVESIPFKAPADGVVDLGDYIKVEVVHAGNGVYRLVNGLGIPVRVSTDNDGTWTIGA